VIGRRGKRKELVRTDDVNLAGGNRKDVRLFWTYVILEGLIMALMLPFQGSSQACSAIGVPRRRHVNLDSMPPASRIAARRRSHVTGIFILSQ
jgi:hypothetical protein